MEIHKNNSEKLFPMQRLQPTISNTSTGTSNSISTHNSSSSSPTSPNPNNNYHNNNNIPGTPMNKSKQKKLYSLQIDTKNTIALCNQYIKENNHLGLALIARQKGIPPLLRHKVWPILLKYHPNVINPYLSANVENDSDNDIPEGKIKSQLMKYFRIRNILDDDSNNNNNHHHHNHHNGNNSNNNNGNVSPDYKTSPLEEEIIRILEASIHKFFKKWGAIIKYDAGFSWIALNLAEWFPPIPNSNYVLIGRDVINQKDPSNKHLTQLSNLNNEIGENETEEFSLDNTNIYDSKKKNSSSSSSSSSSNEDFGISMTFAEVYERLVLVLLHSNESNDSEAIQDEDETTLTGQDKTTVDLISANSLNRMELLFKSGNIESRISFFLLAFAKLLPELYKSLSEEEIINSNSNKNNQWLTWWFKYCGAKVFNKYDRGRLWDLLLGFRLSYSNFEYKYFDNAKLLKRFKKFYNDDDLKIENNHGVEFKTDVFWYKPSDDVKNELKWSQIDYQIQLVFIYISILQKNESKLLEFDQFEIKNFLNKLPNDKFKQDIEFNNENGHNHSHGHGNNGALINNSDYVTNDFEKLLLQAGELWRNWLWNEIRDEINE